MDLVTGIIDIFDSLENGRACRLCMKQCENPVRIKTCGHYFCTNCLESSKKDHNCPDCNEFYEVQHLDYDNIMLLCNEKLLELCELLEEASNVIPKDTNKKDSNTITIPKSCQVLHTLLYHGNTYHINFIEKPAKRNAKGETLLHLACKKQKFNQVRDLVESKVDINAKDYAGWAPLHEAIQTGNLEIVEYLLKKKCLINIPGPEYTTPLHQAASANNVEMVQLLLKYGADKNMVDYTGLKPEDCTKFQPLLDILKGECLTINGKTFEVFLPQQVCLYCHTVDDDVKVKLQCCKQLEVANKMDVKRNLTHFMIKTTHIMSFKILQAMLEGLQFVTQDMADNLIKGDCFINITEHTFLSTDPTLNKGIQKATMSSILKLPKLFDGINFYIEDHVKPVEIYHLKVEKEYLVKLIKAGGGKVLHRPPATRTCESEYTHPFFAPMGANTYSCCNFILYAHNNPPDLIYNMKELQHKTSKWFIDCIVKYEISD
ncbi:BRCA1-associated RING domain protein 1-like isoform X1 [Anthonomus grandis grandis]|uniref:BRCA1-associated RING domain protein 1-like isoform X1 n=1 Tax=Anthonomus grandis grandis TaxID=2921223 RepID=UPI0021669E5A|nr:BRCA1-associated RING domain protein 1-like isoform X1 [Anthonomus grandis grandis]